MGQLDNRPGNTDADNPQVSDNILRSITRDLMNLQQDLVVQMTQDIGRLQTEKSRLLSDIERLQNQYQLLQSEHQTALSRQQLAQQQLWAKQLAQALAAHLQKLLSQQILATEEGSNPEFSHASAQLPGTTAHSNGYNGNAYRLLTSLDSTLSHTLQSLEQDLSSYESSLSRQINRMHSLEQQGEAILEALVERLSQRLQTEASRPRSPQGSENGYYSDATEIGDRLSQGIAAASRLQVPTFNHAGHPVDNHSSQSFTADSQPHRSPVAPGRPAPAPEPSPKPPQSKTLSYQRLTGLQKGIVLIMLSTIALSFHNVVVGVIGYGGQIFGQFPIEGLIRFSIPNSMLILWLRMLFVVPLMAIVAGQLYPQVWQDIRNLIQAGKFRPLAPVIGSGLFLFLSQIMIYTAIANIGPGIAVTILFMYPLLTVPLAWLLFGDRPTRLRVIVMGAISLGVILAALPKLTVASQVSSLGIGTAIFSGIAFAFYLILMQLSFRKLHPVPVSLIQFSTIFVLTSLMLSLLPLNVQVDPANRFGLLIGGAVLGVLTLIGYLLNNFGVRLMGAARASIIASSGPVLTALLAFFITPSPITALSPVQWSGIILVTLGVAALSLERMNISRKSAK